MLVTMTRRFHIFESIRWHPVGAPNDGVMSDLKMINGEDLLIKFHETNKRMCTN